MAETLTSEELFGKKEPETLTTEELKKKEVVTSDQLFGGPQPVAPKKVPRGTSILEMVTDMASMSLADPTPQGPKQIMAEKAAAEETPLQQISRLAAMTFEETGIPRTLTTGFGLIPEIQKAAGGVPEENKLPPGLDIPANYRAGKEILSPPEKPITLSTKAEKLPTPTEQAFRDTLGTLMGYGQATIGTLWQPAAEAVRNLITLPKVAYLKAKGEDKRAEKLLAEPYSEDFFSLEIPAADFGKLPEVVKTAAKASMLTMGVNPDSLNEEQLNTALNFVTDLVQEGAIKNPENVLLIAAVPGAKKLLGEKPPAEYPNRLNALEIGELGAERARRPEGPVPAMIADLPPQMGGVGDVAADPTLHRNIKASLREKAEARAEADLQPPSLWDKVRKHDTENAKIISMAEAINAGGKAGESAEPPGIRPNTEAQRRNVEARQRSFLEADLDGPRTLAAEHGLPPAAPINGGGEHIVWRIKGIPAEGIPDQALKATFPNQFGFTAKIDADGRVGMRQANAEEWARRWAIHRIFGLPEKVLGFVKDANGKLRGIKQGLWISQGAGRHPSLPALIQWLKDNGFVEVKRNRNNNEWGKNAGQWRAFFHPEMKMVAEDVKPENFLMVDGKIVPADVMFRELSEGELGRLARRNPEVTKELEAGGEKIPPPEIDLSRVKERLEQTRDDILRVNQHLKVVKNPLDVAANQKRLDRLLVDEKKLMEMLKVPERAAPRAGPKAPSLSGVSLKELYNRLERHNQNVARGGVLRMGGADPIQKWLEGEIQKRKAQEKVDPAEQIPLSWTELEARAKEGAKAVEPPKPAAPAAAAAPENIHAPEEALAAKLGAVPKPKAAAKPGPLNKIIAQIKEEKPLVKHEFQFSNQRPEWYDQSLAHLKKVAGILRELRQFTGGDRAIGKWDADLQKGAMEARRLWLTLRKQVPKGLDQEGIVNFLDAGGDLAKLKEAARIARDVLKDEKLAAGYEQALKLSPEHLDLANDLVNFYNLKKVQANGRGVFEGGRENYINRIVKSLRGTADQARGGGKIVNKPRFANARHYQSMIEGEQAGVRYHKDLPELVAAYSEELSKAIATKDFVQALMNVKAKDGRPLAAIVGMANRQGDSPLFVSPSLMAEKYRDYKALENPVLHKWKWAGTIKPPEPGGPIKALMADPKVADLAKIFGGEPVNVLLNGELYIHPEVYKIVNNALRESRIRKWYREPGEGWEQMFKDAAKGFDVLQANAKQFMFTASGFHYVQEGTHALGHRINPFFNPFKGLEPIDWNNPVDRALIEHNLKVAGDFNGMAHFREGLAGDNQWLYKIPGAEKTIIPLTEFLFNDYIPWLKMKTAKAMLERNMERYGKLVTKGDISIDQVMRLSAEQANAAYGHLNYTAMGRSPTLQHFWRMTLLAPDFLEARGRFAAQAMKSFVGGHGREQLDAIAVLATIQFVGAQSLNVLLDGQMHLDKPFSVVHNNREWRFRSVPEDLFRLWKDSRSFAMGRTSPGIRLLWEIASQRDWQNKPTGPGKAFLNFLTTFVPMTFRTRKDIEWWQSLLTSWGLQVSRYSPTTRIYDLAETWRRKNDIGEETGVFAPSKYRDMRNALEDQDYAAAKEEYDKLVAESSADKVVQGFRTSLHKPFAGSQKDEIKFKNSLDEIDRITYENAIKFKETTWQSFLKMRNGQVE